MSDNNRQSLAEKAGAAMKPDQQKGVMEQAKDTAKGMADSAASTLQPESQKSNTQKAGDAFSGNSNQSADSMLESAKKAIGLSNETGAGKTKN